MDTDEVVGLFGNDDEIASGEAICRRVDEHREPEHAFIIERVHTVRNGSTQDRCAIRRRGGRAHRYEAAACAGLRAGSRATVARMALASGTPPPSADEEQQRFFGLPIHEVRAALRCSSDGLMASSLLARFGAEIAPKLLDELVRSGLVDEHALEGRHRITELGERFRRVRQRRRFRREAAEHAIRCLLGRCRELVASPTSVCAPRAVYLYGEMLGTDTHVSAVHVALDLPLTDHGAARVAALAAGRIDYLGIGSRRFKDAVEWHRAAAEGTRLFLKRRSPMLDASESPADLPPEEPTMLIFTGEVAPLAPGRTSLA